MVGCGWGVGGGSNSKTVLLIEHVSCACVSSDSAAHPCYNDIVHYANWSILNDPAGGNASEFSAALIRRGNTFLPDDEWHFK